MSKVNTDKETRLAELTAEVEQLRKENARLCAMRAETYAYIRAKVNDMLSVVGTKTLRPEELDDQSLLDFDPIGIVTRTFQHVLESHRKLNQELHFAHDEIQAIFDSVGAALLVLDPRGRVLAYNQKTKDLLLCKEGDVNGLYCHEAVCCQEEQSKAKCTFVDVMKYHSEQRLQEWKLGERSFTVVGRPLFDDAGKISHVVMAYSDVTDHKTAENALRDALQETQEANAKVHGILRSAADSLLVTDADDHIVLMNERAEQLFGFCLSGSTEKPRIDVLPSRPLIKLLSGLAPDGEEVLVQDIALGGEAGSERIYQARVSVIHGADNDYRGRVTLLHDVTREREVERMKSDFVSTAAHELRTPLSTILGYTDLLLTQEEHTRDNWREYLTLIQDKSENLAQIVGDLLDISRIEAGEGLQLSCEPCDLGKICQQVIDEFSLDCKIHQFRAELPDHPVLIEADRYAIVQILENLISNAVKYSPKGGNIVLAAKLNSEMCHLEVSDQGLGMLPDQVEQAFEKFYRADATNTAISGTGLGLTIVKHLVEAHGGQVSLQSQRGHGTCVSVLLPLVQ